MPALRPDPDLFDLDGWRQRLTDLRTEADYPWRDDAIRHAEAHIAAIVASVEKTPVQAR